MLDGHHSGTGGGNHLVLGGATTSRFAAQSDQLLAQSSVLVVSVLWHVYRPDFAGTAD